MDGINEIIICGGGKSIEYGLNLPSNSSLQARLASKCTILTNYAYKTFSGTFLAFTDRDFYVPLYAKKYPEKNPDIYEELKKQPLIIGIDHNGISEFKLDNTILLNNKYRSVLTGIFALKLATELMKEGTIYLCYSEDTEVFTNKGWKYFKDLNKDELILTRKANGETEWSPILNYFKYEYNGTMKHIKSKGIDLLVTPDHSQCLIPKCKHNCKFCNQKNICSNGYIFQPINKLTINQRKIPKTFIWHGKNVNYFYLKDKQIEMNNWVAFLGLYIAEGCCLNRKDKIPNTVIIYQNHDKYKDKIITSILKKLPFNYSYHKRGWEIYSQDLVSYLNTLGKSDTKYIPSEFKQLDILKLNILLKYLMFGDGHYDNKRKTNYYFTVSKQLASDVQEIAYKCGNNAEIYSRKGRKCKISTKLNHVGLESYTVYFNKNNKQGNITSIVSGNLLFNHKITDINYSGNVYDVTVNNHTLWVRRNKVCVCREWIQYRSRNRSLGWSQCHSYA